MNRAEADAGASTYDDDPFPYGRVPGYDVQEVNAAGEVTCGNDHAVFDCRTRKYDLSHRVDDGYAGRQLNGRNLYVQSRSRSGRIGIHPGF